MKQTINEYDFIRAFEDMGRQDNFSRAGLSTLFEMMEEYEEQTGEEIELDVIAICCQFSEYTIDELEDDYTDLSNAIAEYIDGGITQKEAVEEALNNIGAYYRWIDDESLILDVESF